MGISDLNRREFAALTAATAATWRSGAEAETATPVLYPGEELTEASGHPALVRFEPGRPGFPLVVFITGGGVLGRIAYGPPAGRAADFLCHWLHEEGFATLALSYPIDTRGVFDVAFPRFSIMDWAEQSAEIIARHVDGNRLAENVVVLGWSMGGRIAEPLQAALRRRAKRAQFQVGCSREPTWPAHRRDGSCSRSIPIPSSSELRTTTDTGSRSSPI